MKKCKIHVIVFLLIGVLLLFPTFPIIPTTVPSSETESAKNETTCLSKTVKTVTPAEHVSFKNVTFSDVITIANNSIVKITDSNITSSTIYVRDNAKLILEDIDAPYGPDIRLYENATLIFKGSNISTADLDFLVYDNAKLYIMDSFLNESDMYTYDFSEIHINNATMDRLWCYDNSTTSLTNTITYGQIYIYENATLIADGLELNFDLPFYDNSSGILNKINSAKNIRLYSFSTVSISNSTFNDIMLYDYSQAVLNNCSFDDIYIDSTTFTQYSGYRSKANISNSKFDLIQSYSEAKTYLTNVTCNTIYRGFIISGTGKIIGTKVYMSSGTFDYNVVNDTSSKISNFFNRTYFTFENSNFELENPAASRVAAYNSYLQIHGGSVTSRIYGYNSTFKTHNFDMPSYNKFEKCTLILNKTNINGDTMFEHSYIVAMNTSNLYGTIYPENSTMTIINSTFQEIRSTTSSICIENATDSPSTEHIYLENSSLTIKNVDYSYFYISADPSIIILENVTMTKTTIELYNTTITIRSSKFYSTEIELYENVTLHSFESTFDNIHVYGPMSHIELGETEAEYISFDYCANSTGTIQDSSIKTFYTNSDVNNKDVWNSVDVQNSEIEYLHYSVYIYSGTVDITAHRISGGSYISTANLDSNTNVTEYYLEYVEVADGLTLMEDMENVNEIYAHGAEIKLKNITADYVTIASQYSIENCTFQRVYLGYINETLLEEGYLQITPANGTMYLVETYSTGFYGGKSWVTNLTTTYMWNIDCKMHLENSTISQMAQTIYFDSSGNITDGIPYGFSDESIVWGENNIVTENETMVAIIYSGIVKIFNSTVIPVVYNDSQLYLELSITEIIFGYNDSKIYVNSSLAGLMCTDNVYVSTFNSSIYGVWLMESSTLFANKTNISGEIWLRDHANITVVDSIVEENYRRAIVSLWNNSYATFKNSEIKSFLCNAIIQVNDSATVILENVTVYSDNDDYNFELEDNAQLIVKDSRITGTSINEGIGILLDNAQLNINNTQIVTNDVFNRFYLWNTTSLTAFNVNSICPILFDSPVAIMRDSNITGIAASGNSYFEAISSYFMNSSLIMEIYDNSTGKVVNYSVNTVWLGSNSQLYFENIYANYSGSFIEVHEYAKLTALNLTVAEIYTDFLFNLLNKGYINLTDSRVGTLTEEISIYHYGDISIDGTTCISETTVTIFNHTILQNTSINEKEKALNIEEFIDAIIGNTTYTHVSVKRLVDTQPPVVSVTPPSTELEKGMKVEDMNWTVMEEHPDVYELEKNGTKIISGTYSSGQTISLNISAFEPGFWILKFTAKDRAGYSTTVFSNVTVYPSESPIFTAKPPRTYKMIEGTTGNVLNWTATDRFPANYEIYVDGVLKKSGNWTSGTKIEYNIDDLTEGNHTVKIVVYDLAGNSADDTVSVLVKAKGLPMTYLIAIAIGVVVVAVIIMIVIKKRRT